MNASIIFCPQEKSMCFYLFRFNEKKKFPKHICQQFILDDGQIFEKKKTIC